MWTELSDEQYFNEHSSYLSSTDIRRLLRSPAHFKNPQIIDSPALAFGSLAHAFVLLPADAEARYRPRSDVDGRTKEGKQVREWEAALTASQGVKFVSRADYDAAVNIASAVRAHLGAAELLSNGFAEVAGILSDYQGVNVRIKPDFRTSTAIVDLKTTQDGRSDAFTRSILNYGYDVQAALYVDVAAAIDGMKRDFYWVAVEKDSPYAVAVYKASDEMLQRGREQYTRAIEVYKECAALDLWPAYSQQIQTLNLPGWAK